MAEALVDTRPTRFAGYPSIWEMLRAGVVALIAAEPDQQRRRAIHETIEIGLQLVHTQQAGKQPSGQLLADYQRADALVLSGLRARLGLDRDETATIGAALVPRKLIEFFQALGVPLCEGYALSEMPSGTVNPIYAVRMGTVGRPLPGIELHLADDGEILLQGPSMMLGYRNLPDETAEVIDAQGWLHTGDLGELDDEGYLRLLGRKDTLDDQHTPTPPRQIRDRVLDTGQLPTSLQ